MKTTIQIAWPATAGLWISWSRAISGSSLSSLRRIQRVSHSANNHPIAAATGQARIVMRALIPGSRMYEIRWSSEMPSAVSSEKRLRSYLAMCCQERWTLKNHTRHVSTPITARAAALAYPLSFRVYHAATRTAWAAPKILKTVQQIETSALRAELTRSSCRLSSGSVAGSAGSITRGGTASTKPRTTSRTSRRRRPT